MEGTMYNQKLSESLNLLLSSLPSATDYVELILIYNGDISEITDRYNITILLGGYATANVMIRDIPSLASYDYIIYISIPEPVFFSVRFGLMNSCPLSGGSQSISSLTGRGVIIAIIDSGIDIFHPDFLDTDNSTRIIAYWDQSVAGTPPSGYRYGNLYTSSDINRIINSYSNSKASSITPIPRDVSGHGTAVAGICLGNGASSDGVYAGVAPDSMILAVRLRSSITSSYPNTAALMEGIDFAVKYASERNLPIVINLSYGNNYGPHDGYSLVGNYLNTLKSYGRNVIVCGSGNEGASSIHAGGTLRSSETVTIPFSISERETSLTMELWQFYADMLDFSIIYPDGSRQNISPSVNRFRYRNTNIGILYGMPSPISVSQNIFFKFDSNSYYIDGGLYSIEIKARLIKNGRYDIWMQSAGSINQGTNFLYPDEYTTLTTPSDTMNVITVGAYDYTNDSVAFFSGRGFTRLLSAIKPELVAPGVNIISTKSGGGYSSYTGTSFATPFVSGACALLMEWGIVNGNDPYMYSDKIKAFLIRGSRKLSSVSIYPSKQAGWGALCIRDSFL